MSTFIANVAPIVDTNAHYIAYGQSFGGAFTTFGWVAQSGHGEVPATGTGSSYAWTSTTAPTTALTAQAVYNFRGAFVGGTTYTGGNTANGTVDVVTSAGVTYQHITASSSLSTAPASDTTNWQPLIFEIWKSNGTNSTGTNPIAMYIKIIYTVSSTGGTSPRLLLQIGTQIDSSGNIWGGMQLSGSNPISFAVIDNSTTSTSTTNNNVFSGDADNIRWVIQSGQATTGYSNFLCIARSQSSSGTDTNAFVFAGTGFPAATVKVTRSAVFPNTLFSNGLPISQSNTGWAGTVSAGGVAGSTALFGGTPIFPVYPVIGILANPIIGAVGVHIDDVTDGTVVPAWIYGTSHNYFVYAKDSSAASSLDNVVTHGVVPAILFE